MTERVTSKLLGRYFITNAKMKSEQLWRIVAVTVESGAVVVYGEPTNKFGKAEGGKVRAFPLLDLQISGEQ